MTATCIIMYIQGGRHMKQTKVTSVFDGIEMQKYFLYMTKQAEEAAHRAFMESLDMQVSIEEFLHIVKEEPKLKGLIQDLLLSSITNIDWDHSVNHLLLENY